ncbi:MAG: hypothetical protein H0Z29_00490 [Candidatus Marinimicrobia bacterium]|nr:hypothetical protein [Candidatus Neomarinimicrobiota bacterium]
MKNLFVVALIIAVITIILGIITQLVGHALIISAAAWNDLTQTALLFALAFGLWQIISKKE